MRPINSCTSEQFRDIQEVTSFIYHCKAMYCCRMTLPSKCTTSGTLSKCIPSSEVDWSQEGKASEGTGSQCSSQPWTRCVLDKIWKELNAIWTNPESHRRNILGKPITILYIGEIWSLLTKIGCNSVKLDHMPLRFQAYCYWFEKRKSYAWKLVRNFTARYISPQGCRVLHCCRIRNIVVRIYSSQMWENPITLQAKSMSTGELVAATLTTEFQASHTPLLKRWKRIEKKKFDD